MADGEGTSGVAAVLPPNLAPAGDADRRQYLEHLKKINDVFYDQIKSADQKAAYVFTLMIAFLVTSSDGRSAFNLARYQSGDLLAIGLSLLLALAATVSVIAAVLVVLPRHRAATGTSLYWGAWQANRSRLLEAEAVGDPAYLRDQYVGNIDNLAAINSSKYRSVRLSFRALTVAVVAYLLLLVVIQRAAG